MSTRRVRFWDLAATEDGDYTAGVLIARAAGVFYIEDVVRGRWQPHERDRHIIRTAQLDGKKVRIVLEQEPGSAGISVVHSLTKKLAGYMVKSARATGDKVTRADPLASQFGVGNVKIVRGEWNRAFIDELCMFPNGMHDDQVDAAAGALNALLSHKRMLTGM